MTISALSIYQGGAPDVVAPLASALKSIYRKYGVGYRLSRFESGGNKGDWFALVTYADEQAYAEAQARFAADPELQDLFNRISLISRRVSREMVADLEI